MAVRLLLGDCRDVLKTLQSESVHCCICSPPYFGLRDYGVDGQIGLEPTPAEYVEQMVAVFREVRRVLRDDGTLWLNLGDSYAGSWGAQSREHAGKHAPNVSALSANQVVAAQRRASHTGSIPPGSGLKPKDLIGIPWRVAFALQADGWYLRQDIIWAKPNPMPESVRDRCTKAHEYVFLLSKSERYFYDAAAIAEPAQMWSGRAATFDRSGNEVTEHVLPGQSAAQHRPRLPGNVKPPKGQAAYEAGDELQRTKAGLLAYAHRQRNAVVNEADRKALRTDTESRHRSSIPGGQSMQAEPNGTRNKRSVWTIATQPFAEAHFATMAPELAETCIKAGCPEGGTVLDPFGGAGTTGLVADRMQRHAVLCELNAEYIEIARRRIAADAPLFAEVA